MALAGWEYPPLIRGRDFIGIYTGEPKVKYKTALATLAYTEQHLETATTTDHAIEYPYKGEDFLDDLHGVGRNIQLPADRTIPRTLLGESKSHVCTDIMLGIRTYAEVPVGGSVLANYYHKIFTFGQIGIGDSGFSASPMISCSDSQVAVNAS